MLVAENGRSLITLDVFMSSAPKYSPRYTVDDYRLWAGDWELWDGTAVATTPSPIGQHARLVAELARVFGNAIEASGCDVTVLAEIDWIVSRDTVLRPDITVVCGREPDRHVEATPALVVEILSESSRERDLTYKRSMYCDQGVGYYLIVDPVASTLDVLRLGNGAYESVSATDTLVLEICDDCRLEVQTGRLFRK